MNDEPITLLREKLDEMTALRDGQLNAAANYQRQADAAKTTADIYDKSVAAFQAAVDALKPIVQAVAEQPADAETATE